MKNNKVPMVLSFISLATWLFPIVGIPLSLAALIMNIRSNHFLAPFFIFLSAISLVAGGINAYIGFNQGLEASKLPQVTEVIQDTEATKDIWGYPHEFLANFKTACVIAGGQDASCSCGLDILEREYAYPQALEFERTQYPKEYFQKVAAECK